MDTNRCSRFIATTTWLFVILISLTYILNNLSVVSDIQQFMPYDSEDKRLQVLLHETQNSLVSNLILVQIEGASPEYLAQLSQKLKIALEKNHELFASVINGDQSFYLKSFSSLIKYRYLLGHPDDFSVDGLHAAFSDILNAFGVGATDEIIEYLLIDPQKTFLRYLMRQSSHAQIEKFHGVWFDAEKSKALLVIQLRSTGFNLDFLQGGINVIKETVKEVDNRGETELTLSGPGVFAVATRSSIHKTIQLVSWVLTSVVLVLFWYGYRSIRLAFIAGIPLITSIIVAISVTLLIFGELHGIVLAFGITMLGVSLDYPLHLFSHLQKHEAATSTLKRIWPTLRLGAMTSVLAYVALIGTGFSGLTQLAIFAATGLIVALAVTRWLIPLWVSEAWFDKRSISTKAPLTNSLKITVSIGVIGCSLIFLLIQDNIWSSDISQISPISVEARKIDHELRLALHATDVSHIFLLDGTTIDDVLVKTEKLKASMQAAIDNGIFSGVYAASDILPSKERQLYYQTLLPEKNILRGNINAALDGLPFKKNAFDQFMNSINTSKTQAPANYEIILLSPLGSKLKSMLFQQSDQWYSLIRVTGVKNEKAFTSWIKESPNNIEPYYMSLHGATNVLMNSYLQIAWTRLLGVLGIVALVVAWLTFKRKESVWLLVPVIAGVVVSLAFQSVLGNLINIFHVLSLLLVIGMGFDYGLFFNQDWANPDQLQDRTHAILISAITTIVSFGTLGLSDIPILAAMGQTVSVGILTCFILAQRVAVPKQESKEY